MTERKPPEFRFETWVERQIREAQERGAFDNLKGAGQPIPHHGDHDENWWIRNYLERENLPTDVLLPLPLPVQLRKEIERLPEELRALHTEDEVRATVKDLNRRIAECVRAPSTLRIPLALVDMEAVAARWREEHEATRKAWQARRAATREEPSPQRSRWWRR